MRSGDEKAKVADLARQAADTEKAADQMSIEKSGVTRKSVPTLSIMQRAHYQSALSSYWFACTGEINSFRGLFPLIDGFGMRQRHFALNLLY